MLTMKKVPMFGATAHNVKRLYENSVPRRATCAVLVFETSLEHERMEIVAYYDEDVFCGFACLLATEEAVYLYYIAVADDQRNKGYGTQISTIRSSAIQKRPSRLTSKPTIRAQTTMKSARGKAHST